MVIIYHKVYTLWYYVISDSSKEFHPVKSVRLDLGMSQGDFAELLGVRPVSVSRWETGRRSPEFNWEQLVTLDEALAPLGKRILDYKKQPPSAETEGG